MWRYCSHAAVHPLSAVLVAHAPADEQVAAEGTTMPRYPAPESQLAAGVQVAPAAVPTQADVMM